MKGLGSLELRKGNLSDRQCFRAYVYIRLSVTLISYLKLLGLEKVVYCVTARPQDSGIRNGQG